MNRQASARNLVEPARQVFGNGPRFEKHPSRSAGGQPRPKHAHLCPNTRHPSQNDAKLRRSSDPLKSNAIQASSGAISRTETEQLQRRDVWISGRRQSDGALIIHHRLTGPSTPNSVLDTRIKSHDVQQFLKQPVVFPV